MLTDSIRSGPRPFQQVYTYSFVDCIWQHAIPSTPPPSPRMAHLALMLDDRRAFVFGGRGPQGQVTELVTE
jgi:hypothetical protein